MTNVAVSDWQKGGLRYAKLKEIIPAYLAPVKVLAFFVAVRSAGGPLRLANPFSPLQREYVLVATTNGLAILSLRRPGVFRASIQETIYECHPPIEIGWEKGKVVVAGQPPYAPIAFHREDAEQVVAILAGLKAIS
jgi:hypothetical protein